MNADNVGYSEYAVKVQVVAVLERTIYVQVPHTVQVDDRDDKAESLALDIATGDREGWQWQDTGDYETVDVSLEREYNATCTECGNELTDSGECDNVGCYAYDSGE